MTHILQPGEDLWTLAERYYGDAALWDLIYYANRDRIGDDPEVLSPGMEIVIPQLPLADVRMQVVSPVHREQLRRLVE